MKILSGNSNRPLAKKVSDQLAVPLIGSTIKRFADMEIGVEIHENIRGSDVFVIQSTSYPTNDNLVELLLCLDTLRRSSAKRITAVIPYFGYARQDRKTAPRTPISSKLVANLITTAGADRVLTVDLHAAQIQGFFDIPVDNLTSAPLFVRDIRNNFSDFNNVQIVSPDVGGVVRARVVANKLGRDMAIIDKRRESAGVSEVMHIIGNVKGRDCVLIDDIVDSGGTLINAAVALKQDGARSVSVYVTHGVLSGEAAQRIQNSVLDSLVITDTICTREETENCSKIRVISIGELLAEAMNRVSHEQSVSSLFV
jgi:ribose-phosphate pyrophosphokinase